ncbi:hypothetical protein [Streptomyces antibioticus]|uniref:hypothetical protein n=1 Tax=Streptomyces antibioticus TaxID=1890 RepID=UPI00224E3A3C|nr:hypothetical protein [Streptomyces antibioticus]MCX4740796.1 hypothetical protein [Streptomyces antibioticus]
MERPLVTIRAALVLLLAVLSGGTTAVLSWLDGGDAVRSVLAGLAAAALGVSFFNRLIAGTSAEEREHG